MAKTMLAILPFLCCGEIVKNSIIARRDIHGYILSSLKEMCGLSVKKDLNDWSMSIAEKSSQLQDVLEKLKDKEFLRPKLNDFNTRMWSMQKDFQMKDEKIFQCQRHSSFSFHIFLFTLIWGRGVQKLVFTKGF